MHSKLSSVIYVINVASVCKYMQNLLIVMFSVSMVDPKVFQLVRQTRSPVLGQETGRTSYSARGISWRYSLATALFSLAKVS